jgi:hypothetical protein
LAVDGFVTGREDGSSGRAGSGGNDVEDGRVIKPRRYDLNPDEFLAAVAGEMSPAELGVYWMICLLQYSRRGPVKNDMGWLRRKFKASPGLRVVDDAVRSLIASGRVRRVDNELLVSRVREEIEHATSRVRAYTENGRRGGRPSKDINEVEKPSGLIPPARVAPPPPPPSSSLRSEEDKPPALPSVAKPPLKVGPTPKPPIPIADWCPSQKHRELAFSEGHDDAWVERQADCYRDHQANAKLRHRDREAGFRNWIRNSPQFARNGHGNGHAKQSPGMKLYAGAADVEWELNRRRERRNSRDSGRPVVPLLDS